MSGARAKSGWLVYAYGFVKNRTESRHGSNHLCFYSMTRCSACAQDVSRSLSHLNTWHNPWSSFILYSIRVVFNRFLRRFHMNNLLLWYSHVHRSDTVSQYGRLCEPRGWLLWYVLACLWLNSDFKKNLERICIWRRVMTIVITFNRSRNDNFITVYDIRHDWCMTWFRLCHDASAANVSIIKTHDIVIFGRNPGTKFTWV